MALIIFMPKVTTIVSVVVAGFSVGFVCVYAYWWLLSFYKRKTAEPPPRVALRRTLWRDPGEVERLDFAGGRGGKGGAPVPPFHFVEEHAAGTSPCMSVKDARGRTWRVKWGDEVQSETFSSRVAWAAGFHVESNYFVAAGEIEGAKDLTRARECLAEDRRFRDARFELDEPGVEKLFDEHGWSWDDNPFVGTRELAGLKVVMMLVSNWDNKDVRDVARGSNTAIFQHALADGAREARYLIIDWGASMGRWAPVGFRSKWDADAFEAQTPEFVLGVKGGVVEWGYLGQRTEDATLGITVEDVRWLCRYVGRITDEQLREGLRAAAATPEEVERFTRSLRARLEQLRRVGEMGDLYQPSTS
jgi:hypothetical protein